MSVFTKVILFTDTDGRSRFREEAIDLAEGTSDLQLSPLMPCNGYKLRQSPVGFNYDFHCSPNPIWVVVLQGQLEITLQDGSSRLFKTGDALYAMNALPDGAVFDKSIHGHASRQVGPDPLVTLFVRT
ncbi:hypothetical protein [Bradyrhizobium arachidis]|uniref:hypothetical protein n=1 Tax=Bradyrhizobium arachidis TaxID=858423 RepID=UPI0021612A0A|nr:hypothetical protein [Bradyrhizobium arachidis]UVO30438.1 hypothetical protein KUF59_06995 [Bradyrhizobium arachidis]